MKEDGRIYRDWETAGAIRLDKYVNEMDPADGAGGKMLFGTSVHLYVFCTLETTGYNVKTFESLPPLVME